MLLENGSKGSDVTCLEYDLHILNCYTGGFDGDFGPGLEAAVKQFQGRSGLEQDGIVGDGTWGKICEDIKTIQFALDAFGYELQTDGLGGPNTLEAVKVFQESKGLTADGYVGPQTASALGIQYFGTSGSSGSGSIPSGYSAVVKYVQKVLNMIYGEGLSVDGFEGPNTEAEIKRFQGSKGLGQDGIIGPATITALSEAQAASFGCNGGTVSDFVRLAQKQAEIGFLEKGGSSAGNGDNDTPYGMWYGENFEPWCAMFVCWCAHFSGFNKVPRYAYCPTGVDDYKAMGRFHYTGGYTPQYGDVVFYEDQGSSVSTHTGIVISYNSGNNTITTVEGNAADNVAVWTRSLDQNVHLRVLGFGDNGGGSSSSGGSTGKTTSPIYNRYNSVEYAKTYWNNYNSEYFDYANAPERIALAGQLHGSDCANFVSQCLHAGGINETNYWYFKWDDHNFGVPGASEIKVPDASISWINVQKQMEYFIENGYVSEVILFNSLEDLNSKALSYGIQSGDVAYLVYKQNTNIETGRIPTDVNQINNMILMEKIIQEKK